MTNKENTSPPTPEDELSRPVPRMEKRAITERALKEKINLFSARLKSLDGLQDLSFSEFVESLPGFKRLMPLLSQSVIDLCYSLLRRYTAREPVSVYDIIDSCEQYGIVPVRLVRPLSMHLVLIQKGFDDLSRDELAQVHRVLPDTIQHFQQFLEHCKTFLDSKHAR